MSTDLVYNGVTFHGCQTLEFSQSAVYDQLAGTDVVRHEFRITVQGVVHSNAGGPQWTESQNSQAGSGGGAAVFLNLRQQLMCPRKLLAYTVAGVEILNVGSSEDAGNTEDVNNGPRPIDLRIVNIARNVLKVQFTIGVSIVSCCDSGALPAVLNNKWSIEEAIDENFVTTRSIHGRLRTSSINHNPQSFRSLVIPPLERGWKIQSARFLTDPSGMELDYTIVHSKIHAAPPRPAVDWDCRHTVSTSRGGIAKAHMSVMLLGDPDVDRRALIGAAVAVAESRLGSITSGIDNGKVIIDNLSVTDFVSEPRVELDIQVQYVSVTYEYAAAGTVMGNAATAAFIGQTFGKPLAVAGYDPKTSPSPKSYGPSTLTGAFRMYLQDPCVGPSPISRSSGGSGASNTYSPPTNPSTGQPFGGGYSVPSITTYEGKLTPYPSKTSSYMSEGLYTFYKIETTYSTAGGVIAMPVALDVDENGEVVDSDADQIKIIRVGPGITYRTVKIHAERIGQWPQLPSPKDYGGDAAGGKKNPNAAGGSKGGGVIKSTLIDHSYTPCAPELMPDANTYRYEAYCVLTFVMARALKAGDLLSAGASPVDRSKPSENRLLLSDNQGAQIIE